MRYEILGPPRLVGKGGVVPVEAPKMQLVLIALLIHREQVVSVEKLIRETWGQGPPRRATAGIHVYISHLRKLISQASGGKQPIITKPSGYLLQVGADELDFADFEQFFAAGKAAYQESRHEEAGHHFRQALQLWRGSITDETKNAPMARGFALRLAEMRLESAELMASSALALGQYREAVGLLYPLVSEHPLNESLYQKLMFALYRTGRRADALKVYQSARQLLQAELGLEPSLPLRELQQKILLADEPPAAITTRHYG